MLIVDGSTVELMLSTIAPRVTYAVSYQTVDWGALPGPDDALDFGIVQRFAVAGRGAIQISTLTF